MKLLDYKLWGNPVLSSDRGRISIEKKDGIVGYTGYVTPSMIGLTEEEQNMVNKPKEMWVEFFRQQTQDDV